MRHTNLFLITLLIFFVSGIANARDSKHLFPINDAMNSLAAQQSLTAGVKFYFGPQKHESIKSRIGEDFTNKKTNAFNKDDKTACEWVFISTMIGLQERARQLGADAIVNIHSFYKKIPFVSETEYECHAGGLMAGVALKGTFVKLGAGGVSGNQGIVTAGNTSNYDPQVKEMQRILTAHGYDPGPVDGYMGKKTSDAIKIFQLENGLNVTAALDVETISAIRNSDSDAGKDRRNASDNASTGEGRKSTQNNCTVEQILELQKIGLTAKQISSACDA